jgi:hypothetical protein
MLKIPAPPQSIPVEPHRSEPRWLRNRQDAHFGGLDDRPSASRASDAARRAEPLLWLHSIRLPQPIVAEGQGACHQEMRIWSAPGSKQRTDDKTHPFLVLGFSRWIGDSSFLSHGPMTKDAPHTRHLPVIVNRLQGRDRWLPCTRYCCYFYAV